MGCNKAVAETLVRLFVMWVGGFFAMFSDPPLFTLAVNVWLLWSALTFTFLGIIGGF